MRLSTTVASVMMVVATNAAVFGQSLGEAAPRPEPVRPERQDLPERSSLPERPVTPERPVVTERPTPEVRTAPPERPTIPERTPAPARPTTPERSVTPERSPAPERPVVTPERPAGPVTPASLDRPTTPERPLESPRPSAPQPTGMSHRSAAPPVAAAPQQAPSSNPAIQRALESRQDLLDRARSMHTPAVISAYAQNVEYLSRSGSQPGSFAVEGPQSGTGRIPEAVRERRSDMVSRIQHARPVTGAGSQSQPGAGLTSREREVGVGGPGGPRDPGTGSDPGTGVFPGPGGGTGGTNVGNRPGNPEIDVNLRQRLAYLDLMRDRAIDNRDPGPLNEIDHEEEITRRQHEQRIGNRGTGGGGGKLPEPPLPPGGKADSGWFSGIRNAMKRGGRRIMRR